MSDDQLQSALAAHKSGDFKRAERSYRLVLQELPSDPTANHMLGVILLKTDRAKQAIEVLRTAAKLNANSYEVWFDLGTGHKKLGDFPDAIECFQKALSIKPDLNAALFQIGLTQKAAKQWAEADKTFCHFVDVAGDQPQGHIELGYLARRTGDLLTALTHFERATTCTFQAPEAWHGYGRNLADMGEASPAIHALQKAVDLDPNYLQGWVSLVATVKDFQGAEKALPIVEEVIVKAPDYEWLHMTKADLLFSMGRLAEAWTEYAWREKPFTRFSSNNAKLGPPKWDGSPLTGKHVLVTAEQGLGEQIMFSSMIPDLLSEAASVTIECEPRLDPLFARSFPGANLVHRPFHINESFAQEKMDVQVRLGTLGRLYRSNIEAFPKHGGYLKVNATAVADLRARYKEIAGSRRLVGVSWRSQNRHSGWQKSIPLDQWKPLLVRDEILGVDLQYGNTGAERVQAAAAGFHLHHDESVDPKQSVDIAAAQIAAMDVVISSSNTAAHLAGSLNKTSIVMLHKRIRQHWYWFPERVANPWYPSVTIVQQRQPGDWSDTLAEAGTFLDNAIRSAN